MQRQAMLLALGLSWLLLGREARAQLDSGGYADEPPPKRAAPPPAEEDRWARRRFAVLGQAGFGTPLGLLGVSAEWSPQSWLALGAGVGINQRGLQLAAMPRVRILLSGSTALSFGAGASYGPYGVEAHHYAHALWGNWDLGLERLTRRGLQWRIFLGRGGVLASSGPVCGDYAECVGGSRPVIAYVGFAMGYAFPLGEAR